MDGNDKGGLTAEDRLHLREAEGWTELGLPDEALKSLDQIDPAKQKLPTVFSQRWGIHYDLGQTDKCSELAPVRRKTIPSILCNLVRILVLGFPKAFRHDFRRWMAKHEKDSGR